MINNQSVVEEIVSHLGEKVFAFEEPYGLLTFNTTAEHLLKVIQFLKEHPQLKFTFLTDISGIHFPNDSGRELGSVYHLHSWENNIRIRIKIFVPKDAPYVPSLTELFVGANWMERESYDFYGILYTGHPNLKRILNIDEMDYHPMRKEYPLEDSSRNDKIDPLFGR